jgi:hypothetical protein
MLRRKLDQERISEALLARVAKMVIGENSQGGSSQTSIPKSLPA